MVPLLRQSRQLDWSGGQKPYFSRGSKAQAKIVLRFFLEQLDLGTVAVCGNMGDSFSSVHVL